MSPCTTILEESIAVTEENAIGSLIARSEIISDTQITAMTDLALVDYVGTRIVKFAMEIRPLVVEVHTRFMAETKAGRKFVGYTNFDKFCEDFWNYTGRQIRNIINGTPTPKRLPSSRKEKPEYETPPEHLKVVHKFREWMETETPNSSKRVFVKTSGFGYGAGMGQGLKTGELQPSFDLELRSLDESQAQAIVRFLESQLTAVASYTLAVVPSTAAVPQPKVEKAPMLSEVMDAQNVVERFSVEYQRETMAGEAFYYISDADDLDVFSTNPFPKFSTRAEAEDYLRTTPLSEAQVVALAGLRDHGPVHALKTQEIVATESMQLVEVHSSKGKRAMWKSYKKHHYAPDTFNVAARVFRVIPSLDRNVIGMTACLPLPSGTLQNAWRSHKVVVLPEFKHLWRVAADTQAKILVAEGKRYFCNASDAPADLIAYRDDLNSGWVPTSKHGKPPKDTGHGEKFGNLPRSVNEHGLVVSHEFIGMTSEGGAEAAPTASVVAA
jgi:hypothetical protein